MRGPGYAIGGGGGAALRAPITALAGYTETDPSAIKTATAQGALVGAAWPGASYINATLTNAVAVSGLPNTGLRWTRPTKGLKGIARNSDTRDLLQVCFGITSDAAPLSLDLVLGWFITNGTVGYGGGIQAAAGLWQVFGLSQNAGTWTLTASAGASAASTVGARAQCESTNGTTTRVHRCDATDSNLLVVPATSGAAGATLTLADGLNQFGLYTGWGTGVGGTPGTVVKIAGAEILGDQSDLFS